MGTIAHAQTPHESLIFVSGSSLWMMTGESSDAVEAIELATTPADAGAITRVQANTAGIVIETQRGVFFAPLPAGTTRIAAAATPLPCKPPARISTTVDRVSCMDERASVRLFDVSVRPPRLIAVSAHGRLSLEFAGGDRLVSVDTHGLWSVSPSGPGNSTAPVLLSPDPTHEHLSVAPDGIRAVASFALNATGADQREHALYSIKLDGKGTKRRLMKYAVPIAWSGDSRWLLVQRRKRACVVRAVGGQYKCWRGYTALDIDDSGDRVLLFKYGEGDPDTDDTDDTGDTEHTSSSADTEQTGYDKASVNGGIVAVHEQLPDTDSEPPVPPGGLGRLYLAPTPGVRPAHPRLLLERQTTSAAAWVDPARASPD